MCLPPLSWPTHANIIEETSCRPDRTDYSRIRDLSFQRDDASRGFQRGKTVDSHSQCGSFALDPFACRDLLLLRAALAQVEGFPAKSGSLAFRTDLRNAARGLLGYFPSRPPRSPRAPPSPPAP